MLVAGNKALVVLCMPQLGERAGDAFYTMRKGFLWFVSLGLDKLKDVGLPGATGFGKDPTLCLGVLQSWGTVPVVWARGGRKGGSDYLVIGAQEEWRRLKQHRCGNWGLVTNSSTHVLTSEVEKACLLLVI